MSARVSFSIGSNTNINRYKRLRLTGFPTLALIRVILLSILLGLPVAGQGQGLGVENLAVLVDDSGSETIDSVSASAALSRFTPLRGILQSGFTSKVHWLRFSVMVPRSGSWWLEVEPPTLDDLRLFEPGAAGFKERRSGDRLPFSSREEDYRGFIFKLSLPDTTPRVFYLRVQTSSASLAELKLWDPEEFDSARLKEYAALSFYYGFTALAVLISLILFVWLGETLYGWFGLMILAGLSLRFAAHGLVAQYLLPNSPLIADEWVGFSALLYMVSIAPFYRNVLGVQPGQRFYFNVFRVQMVLPCVMAPLLLTSLHVEGMMIAVCYMLLVALVVIYECVQQWRLGRNESRYLLLGAVLLALGGVRLALLKMGWNTTYDLSPLYFDQITSMLSIVVVYIALALRLRSARSRERRSEQRAYRAEFKAEKEHEAYAEQGRFIAMLSHELKTPLAVIDSATQALERINRSEDPEIARRHERIRRSVGRIDRMIEQFLSKDQLELQRMELHPVPIDLSQLIGEVFDACADDDCRFELSCADDHLTLLADRALLRVALINLVDNALKYSPPEGMVSVSVCPSVQWGRAGIEILVADQGSGVPAAVRDALFTRYTRGDNTTGISGTGLGLYLVRRIVELHHGRVELRTSTTGALFWIWLPVPVEASP
jgi:signal transduction histidine kinase